MMRNVFYVKHLESLIVDEEDGHWCCTFCWSPACHTVWQTGCDHYINVQFCSCSCQTVLRVPKVIQFVFGCDKGPAAYHQPCFLKDRVESRMIPQYFTWKGSLKVSPDTNTSGSLPKCVFVEKHVNSLGYTEEHVIKAFLSIHVIVVLSLEAACCSVFTWT